MTPVCEHVSGGIISTGVEGLDRVLGGGLPACRMYLVRGGPGTGKTTLCIQFLLEGIRCGERCLYISVAGGAEELCAVAVSHGWFLDTDLFRVQEIEIPEHVIDAPEYTMFHPSEVELGQTIRGIFSVIEEWKPKRVVIDSLAELRLLAENELSYRRQILAMKKFFTGCNCTALLTDYGSTEGADLNLEALTYGMIALEHNTLEYGQIRRKLHVPKLRGREFSSGYHDFTIRPGGLQVFPRLIATKLRECCSPPRQMSSGIPELDQLAGGGFSQGTSTAVIGQSGAGKTTLALQYAVAAGARGERSTFYLFDESPESFIRRGAGLGLPVRELVRDGLIALRPLDIAEVSPGEFVAALKEEVEQRKVSLVVIDSLNGYLNAMPSEKYLVVQLHELLEFLGGSGVATFLIVAQHGIFETTPPDLDMSYLADNLVLVRFFELRGEVRRALSVVKKRGGPHETTIREMTITGEGLRIGAPLREIQGVLTGIPFFVGTGGSNERRPG